jgi:16S rRNA U516 pseudouridylate synthase RsuA-like enzyme
VRLNKLLASRGLGARRKCDELIEAGSVRVNGTVVREAGVKVEPERDRIEVHGRPIPGPSALRYVMLHKPVGVITTLDDPEGGRPCVPCCRRARASFPVGASTPRPAAC